MTVFPRASSNRGARLGVRREVRIELSHNLVPQLRSHPTGRTDGDHGKALGLREIELSTYAIGVDDSAFIGFVAHDEDRDPGLRDQLFAVGRKRLLSFRGVLDPYGERPEQ